MSRKVAICGNIRFRESLSFKLGRCHSTALPDPVYLLELRSTRIAIAELLLLAVAGGTLGAYIVLRRLAFFTHAAGTATFPGSVLAEAARFSPRLAALARGRGLRGGRRAGGPRRARPRRGAPPA